VIPIERTGGLGVMILEHELGIEVQRVWPGTPAAEMGLEAGDIITEVDGLPSSALTMDEFIQVMTGPVGTDVDFALAYEEDTGMTEEVITLTRAWLE
jgi:carboxyl-terminal processing protease